MSCWLCETVFTKSNPKSPQPTQLRKTMLLDTFPVLSDKLPDETDLCTVCVQSLEQLHHFKADCIRNIHVYSTAQSSHGVNVECLLCHNEIESLFYYVRNHDGDSGNIIPTGLLLCCFPDLEVDENRIMCEKCVVSTHEMYEFQQKCVVKSVIESLKKETDDDILREVKAENLGYTNDIQMPVDQCLKNAEDMLMKVKKELGDGYIYPHSSRLYISQSDVDKEALTTSECLEKTTENVNKGSSESDVQPSQIPGTLLEAEKAAPEQNAKSISDYFKCPDCDFLTKTKYYLKTHAYFHHNNGEIEIHKCSVCGYQSKWKHSIKIHTILKHDKKDDMKLHSCSFCDYQTFWKSNLYQHIKCKHSKQVKTVMFKCEVCSYKTGIKHHLRQHNLHKHTSEDEIHWYSCDQCDFRSKRKDRLKNHTETKHRKETVAHPHKCPECDYRASRKDNLKQHIECKHMKKEVTEAYKCSECSYKTSIAAYLRKHKIHKHMPKTKVHKCKLCEFETVWRPSLTHHIKSKHSDKGKNTFSCPACDYVAIRNDLLHRHIKRNHKKVPIMKVDIKEENLPDVHIKLEDIEPPQVREEKPVIIDTKTEINISDLGHTSESVLDVSTYVKKEVIG